MIGHEPWEDEVLVRQLPPEARAIFWAFQRAVMECRSYRKAEFDMSWAQPKDIAKAVALERMWLINRGWAFLTQLAFFEVSCPNELMYKRWLVGQYGFWKEDSKLGDAQRLAFDMTPKIGDSSGYNNNHPIDVRSMDRRRAHVA